MEKKMMNITLEQQKVISSPLRSKIIYLLAEDPKTAKQVADEMGKTAGSIHYHIQQLLSHGIIELVETKENRGIIEKYYLSKATHFSMGKQNTEMTNQENEEQISINISLNNAEKEEFNHEIEELFIKYIKRTIKDQPNRSSYQVAAIFNKISDGQEE
ncbi:ArsR/SmtB family transcription factor [Cytobacillus purgationiresistens]|uniref:ArsR family transcriptional regulator n=1 Tax=Cytobacillus purgationiresistens TaxID=863449 RepID=A0ABU0AL70_9BACI|nr:helix-turn-helix domain-containing protein [Cytobacillus purgationiresistens]MDQ0271476.1 putative ArsR family transcriptional regulator [Cytobacillus purgationiresistens]